MKIAFAIVAAIIALLVLTGYRINRDGNCADDRIGAAIFYMAAMVGGVLELVLLIAIVLSR